jgi:hypothetical protein
MKIPHFVGTPILGPEACRVFGTEESCNPNSAAAETALLYSKSVLLGQSDSVSNRRALERMLRLLCFETGPVAPIVPSLENWLNEAH